MDMDISPEGAARKKLSRPAPSDSELASSAAASAAPGSSSYSVPSASSFSASSSSLPASNPAKKPKPSPSPIDAQLPSAATPLNEFEQLNFDEGYSGEKTPTPYHEKQHPPLSHHEAVKIPPWMTGLRPDIREEYAFKLVRSLPTANIASLVDRLVPILHLDFVQFLPAELSLHILSFLPARSLLNAALTSRQWRRYALEPGLWKALYLQQGWEANNEEVRRFEREMAERTRMELRQRGSPAGGDPAMSFSHSETSDGAQPPGYVNNSSMSDDEELYPTPNGSFHPMVPDLSLTVTPTLLAPGYHPTDPPRLNWMFLFKHRKRLERNWRYNRHKQFHIPSPLYAHEAHTECVYTISYSAKWLVSGSRDKTIRIWNLKTRRLRSDPLVGHDASVLCLQFDEAPEEDVIISGSSDASVIIWRFSTGEMLRKIRKAHDESVLNLRFNKKWLITCSKDKLIKVWNRRELETHDKDYPWQSKTLWENGREPRYHPHHPEFNPAFVVQDPVASSGLNLANPFAKPVKQEVRTLPEYTVVNELRGHSAAVNAIQLYEDQVVSVSGDRCIKLWNLHTGLCAKTYLGHEKGIACIQYDGRTIVSGSSDRTIRIFDGESQAEKATLNGHTALVRTVQATKNKIISGSYDETVRIWVKDDQDTTWTHHAKLTQEPMQPHPNPQLSHLQQQAMQQFQQNLAQPPFPTPSPQQQASVITHQAHPVGSAALMGAIAATQLLNNPQHQQPQLVHHAAFPNGIPAAFLAAAGNNQAAPSAPPANAGPAAVGGLIQQQQQQQMMMPPGAGPQQVSGAHRVFKLQFDSRWIICCTQHTRIVGWDYAAGDEGIIEASRFFAGA